jgi:hypothetical protein
VIEFRDERAAVGATPDPQHTELFQRAVRLPHRHAAGLVLARHLPLGGQLVAGHEPAIGDLLLDTADDGFRDPAPAHAG